MRKRFFQQDNSEEANIDMTPMLDIVFILLIFFIVTTSFVKESGVKVNRPSAIKSSSKKSANIIVAIKSNGDIWVDKQEVELSNLTPKIERLFANSSQSSVIIQADKKALTDITVKVIDKIRLAGIYNISLATTK